MAEAFGYLFQTGIVTTAGATRTIDIAGSTAMGGNIKAGAGVAADYFILQNPSNKGKLKLAISQNGVDFTAGAFTLPSNQQVTLFSVNFNKIKLDATVSGTGFSFAAVRMNRG